MVDSRFFLFFFFFPTKSSYETHTFQPLREKSLVRECGKQQSDIDLARVFLRRKTINILATNRDEYIFNNVSPCNINLVYLIPSTDARAFPSGQSRRRGWGRGGERGGRRYFFNVISKLENLSGVATATINLGGSRIASFSIFCSYDATFGCTGTNIGSKHAGLALRQIDHRNTFLIGERNPLVARATPPACPLAQSP